MTVADSNHKIEVPEAPSIPGLSFRRAQGESDFPGMAEVFTRSWEADGRQLQLNAEEVAGVYSNMRNSDLYHDFLMVEMDGGPEMQPQLVGYGRAEWQDEESGDGSGTIRIYTFKFYIVPEWRGVGIERAMLLYYENHLKAVAASQDFAGACYLQSFVSDRSLEYIRALETAGYDAVRCEYDMVRPDTENIPDLPLPEGLEARPVQPEQFRAIWEAEVEATWLLGEPEEGDYEHWLNYPNFQPHLWQVAWDSESNQVAGM